MKYNIEFYVMLTVSISEKGIIARCNPMQLYRRMKTKTMNMTPPSLIVIELTTCRDKNNNSNSASQEDFENL